MLSLEVGHKGLVVVEEVIGETVDGNLLKLLRLRWSSIVFPTQV